MNNKIKIAGIVAVIVLATIIGVWSRNTEEDVLILPEETAEIPVENVSEESSENVSVPADEITVHVCGCVKNPGVYTLDSGMRVNDAVMAAGGFTFDADRDYLNLADAVCDGTKIYIPSSEETADIGFEDSISLNTGKEAAAGDGLINLNTATREELMTLSGVGESKADAIIRYRDECGPFERIEDIMNIRGIKDGLFNKIKDKIKV